jgi:hypothetical protein
MMPIHFASLGNKTNPHHLEDQATLHLCVGPGNAEFPVSLGTAEHRLTNQPQKHRSECRIGTSRYCQRKSTTVTRWWAALGGHISHRSRKADGLASFLRMCGLGPFPLPPPPMGKSWKMLFGSWLIPADPSPAVEPKVCI